jgi:hypothetical protein
MKLMKKVLLFACFVLQFGAYSQNKVATIVDAISGGTISYANIKLSATSNNISNADGQFNIPSSLENESTKIEISHIGYETQQLSFSQLEKQNFIVKLVPGIYELNNVDVSDKKQDVASIMAKVKANLDENYKTSMTPISQNRIFLRQQNTFIPKQLDIKIEKSTGFSKSKLKEVNAEIKSFVSNMTKTPPKEFKDFLSDYASSWDEKENSWNEITKLNVVKATKIKDESRIGSIDNLEVSAGNMFLKHLDTTKFYRIKSGWIGSRDTISFSKEFKKKQAKNKSRKNYRDRAEPENEPKDLQEAKISINNVLASGNTLSSRNTSYLRYLDWYEYTLEGATFTEDYKWVYVIKFKPKKGKAKYEGTLYVSETDYAVVKATYNLAKGKTLGGINLKWILGVKAFENVSNGTLIYKENSDTKKYYLQYANLEDGQYFYVNRPLKFIELAEEDKDVFAVDIKVEGDMLNKYEFLNIEQKEISEADFKNFNQPDFIFIKLKKYDPKIWKEFTTLEPAEEMKQFSINEL